MKRTKFALAFSLLSLKRAPFLANFDLEQNLFCTFFNSLCFHRVPGQLRDNYATHKTALIRDWLAKRPRWHVHLTPTSSSWLNQVERFFAALTDKQIRRGVHRSVEELEAAITAFLDHHYANPKPFRWVKSADDILAAIERFCSYNTPST